MSLYVISWASLGVQYASTVVFHWHMSKPFFGVVVKILFLFGVPIIIRHLYLGYPKKGP